jgi:hypothetical protein
MVLNTQGVDQRRGPLAETRGPSCTALVVAIQERDLMIPKIYVPYQQRWGVI